MFFNSEYSRESWSRVGYLQHLVRVERISLFLLGPGIINLFHSLEI